MTNIYNTCIIGSGVAGYTAAIYAARSMLNPIMIAGYSVGGQLTTTDIIENYPGFPDGIKGVNLMRNLHEQALKFGTVFCDMSVKNVDTLSKPYQIFLTDGSVILSKTIIITTGAEALWLNLPGEKELRSRGLSTCAVCDGAFFTDSNLLVIGGGDTAMEEALFLTRYAKRVTIVHRRDEFRASKIMLDRARKHPKIDWITNAKVHCWESTNDGDLSGATLDINGERMSVKCDGAFIAIGHNPVTKFLNRQIELDEEGYIILKKNTSTSIPGIFAAGDVTDRRYKQAITAAGQGCQAAMDVEKWLEDHVNYINCS